MTKDRPADTSPGQPAGYLAVLTTPGAPRPAVWSLVGRFGFAGSNLALLTYVQAVTGSFAFAGAMMALSLAGTALTGPVQGRLIDRFGPRRPLLALSGAHCAVSALLVLVVSRPHGSMTHTALLGAAVLAQSATQPMVAVASRAMWPRLLPPGPRRETAFSYETVTTEACYLLAPALSVTLATLLWPGTSLVCTVVLVAGASLGFATAPVVRAWSDAPHQDTSPPPGRPEEGTTAPDRHVVDRRPVLRLPGMPPLLVAALGFGVGVGFVTVTTTAAADALDASRYTGLLLAAWSVSSVLGGLVYNRRPWPRSPAVRLPLLTAAFGLLLLPALAGGVPGIAVALVLSGATLAPQLTAQTILLDRLVPTSRITEAYSWVTTLVAAGNAAGQAGSGVLVERFGHRTTFLICTCLILVFAALVGSRRRHMAGAPDPLEPSAETQKSAHPAR
ncbi:MFS transporter [Streptomyces sp. NPDC048737]|uniref:MFS transporter n=1 Tax=unclassified Streptomyces TaxID=2593676 RepID=UPI00342B67BF